jgi:uncharacterized protein (TIGR03437 family)
MFARNLGGVTAGLAIEDGEDTLDAVFRVGELNVRQVGDRNAPSIINAVFNFRNFWDGRASDVFTGATPFGLSDTRPNALTDANGGLKLEMVRLDNSSLASQAVGPVLNTAEMSYGSRKWPQVGKKMLALRPLAYQKIAPDDSVLGPFANPSGKGFKDRTTYLDMVKAAFQPTYWTSTQVVNESGTVVNAAVNTPASTRFSQAEFNFSLFFGLAVQAYESTLVSDDSKFDRFADGQSSALSNNEISGMLLFIGRTGCSTCHAGAEFTLASHSGVNGNDPLKSGRETGYFYIGVRPINEDIGLGALDDLGKPLSGTFPADGSPGSARGRIKTPGLRNVEFTGPYFHDGGQATLEQVMEFYNRGGDFAPNASNGPNIRTLQLSPQDQADVVAFMKALTDDRVRFERAPFDHPELCVPNGHPNGVGTSVQPEGNPLFGRSAADRWAGIPAAGRNGNAVPLQTFEELLNGVGADGSRAHNLNDTCEIPALTATGFANLNAAALKRATIAQDSIVSAFGSNFTDSATSAASNPAPTTLGGLSVQVQDSAGVTRDAPLFYVSPGQINYVVPTGTAPGPATISVTGGSRSFQARVYVASVSPGLFSASGLAAANILTVRDDVQTFTDAIRVSSDGALEPAPIELGGGSQVFLILYGTGIRNHSGAITATIGTNTVPVAFAGAQGTFAGEDQINILLPQTLRGAGVVDVMLNVDGQPTNSVKIHIR